ncbi:alpha/beta-hydrolase [Flagelloscypha sp. PMI_526]|nr:alpha/beta-hydrolase [Flagelloscypha sp. PMI_526]KAH8830990.1 alpha/beta-hydrolase [Flagelloscypha sp. PMI_526]
MSWLISLSSFLCLIGLVTLSKSAPIFQRAVSTLNVQDVNAFTPLIQFAQAPYCTDDGAQSLKDWSCGPACDANPTFEPAVAGGDGGDVQFFVAGFWPDKKQIVLSYQGTDPFELQAVLTDLDIFPDSLDKTLFPGLPEEAKVHGGFQDAFKASSDTIFPAIQKLIDEKGTKDIIVTGHSLGGALAQLAAMHMALTIPDANIELFTLGCPRVGNIEWATSVTDKVPNNSRVNNQDDIVPIIPGRSFGFSHPDGEVHLLDDNGKAVRCTGIDSEEKDCTIDSVSNILLGNPLDHLGPYNGIGLGLLSC